MQIMSRGGKEIKMKKDNLKLLTARMINFSLELLTILKVDSDEFNHYTGVCEVYRKFCNAVDIAVFVKHYNKSLSEVSEIFLEAECPRASEYLITIPESLYDAGIKTKTTFSGVLLSRRVDLIKFILAQLRELEAFLEGRNNNVIEEVFHHMSYQAERTKS